ncbi:MAG: hypothetical protein ABW164_05525 [Sphingobium sp.]
MANTSDTPDTGAVAQEPLKGATYGSSAAAASETAAYGSSTTGEASEGLAAKVAPLKAQAEKAAKAASEKLQSVDWQAHVEPLKEQAASTARSAAGTAKGATGSAMQSLSRLISDTASTVDAKLGPQYGDYARQAAQTVANAADTLESKDVDELMDEARDFVRKSPAVAIGAAAVVGYVLMRLAKGASTEES